MVANFPEICILEVGCRSTCLSLRNQALLGHVHCNLQGGMGSSSMNKATLQFGESKSTTRAIRMVSDSNQ